MSSDVVLTAAMRSNLLSLQGTQNLIDKTQYNLATGRKVNSALDNPQSFFTAQGLSNRASDLGRLLDGIGQSIRAIEQANTGITALTDLVEQAQSVADQAKTALSDASSAAVAVSDSTELKGKAAEKIIGTVTGAVAADAFTIKVGDEVLETFAIDANTTLNSLVAEINDRATDTEKSFEASISSTGQLQISSTNGDRLTLDDTTGTLLDDLNVITQGTTAAETFLPGGSLDIKLTGTGIIDSNTALSGLTQFAGFTQTADTLSIEVDGVGTTTLLIGNSGTGPKTIDDLVDAINANAIAGGDLEGMSAVFDDATDTIKIVADSSVGNFSLTAAGGATVDLGQGQSASGTELFFKPGEGAGVDETLAGLASDFDNIRAQIDAIVKDANYRGTNLLNGDDLTTTFDENGTSTLVTDGVTFTSSGLNIEEADFTSSINIQESVDQAKAALDTVRQFGNSIANDLSIIQTRQNFTEQTITTLKAGADDLTVADQNEEGANLLALQTRQQLGVTSLSLAAQSQQAVLRLF